MEKRGKFSGSLGFILAAAGSAVGLGNIWRFPYLAAKYGGGIFLLIYVILVVTFGYTIMISEISLGRKTGLEPNRRISSTIKEVQLYRMDCRFCRIHYFVVLQRYRRLGGKVFL